MINHVVLFKLKEFESEQAKKQAVAEIKEGLLSLKDKIAELKYIEVGTNYEVAAKSFDICLITHFESLADLNVYAVHTEHLKVVDIVRKYAVDRAAVDFEF